MEALQDQLVLLFGVHIRRLVVILQLLLEECLQKHEGVDNLVFQELESFLPVTVSARHGLLNVTDQSAGLEHGLNHSYMLQSPLEERLQGLNRSFLMYLLNGRDASPLLQMLSYVPSVSLFEILTPVPAVGDFESDLEFDGHVNQHEHPQLAFSQDLHHGGEVVQNLPGLDPAHVLPPKRLSLDQFNSMVLHLQFLSPIGGPLLENCLALRPLRFVHLFLSQKCSLLSTVIQFVDLLK